MLTMTYYAQDFLSCNCYQVKFRVRTENQKKEQDFFTFLLAILVNDSLQASFTAPANSFKLIQAVHNSSVKDFSWGNHSLHCKCETVTVLVFSCGSVPAVLQQSFCQVVVGPITSCSCSTSLRCKGSNYQKPK